MRPEPRKFFLLKPMIFISFVLLISIYLIYNTERQMVEINELDGCFHVYLVSKNSLMESLK